MTQIELTALFFFASERRKGQSPWTLGEHVTPAVRVPANGGVELDRGSGLIDSVNDHLGGVFFGKCLVAVDDVRRRSAKVVGKGAKDR